MVLYYVSTHATENLHYIGFVFLLLTWKLLVGATSCSCIVLGVEFVGYFIQCHRCSKLYVRYFIGLFRVCLRGKGSSLAPACRAIHLATLYL